MAGRPPRHNNGNRPEGPPDLEEIWRDLNRQLGGLFGEKKDRRRPPGNSGNGNNGLPPINVQALKRGFAIFAILLLLAWLISGFYIVGAPQRGVVLRFGKFVGETDPGLRWRLPYPIESHELVNHAEVRTVEIGYRSAANDAVSKVPREALMLTDDENIIDIQFAVQYVLKSPTDYLFKSRDPAQAVKQAAETAVRETVGKNRIDFILNEGRAEIADAVHKLMQTILDRYGTGVQISRVNMRDAQPPEQVQAAFEDAVKAGQDKERLEYEGRAYASDIVPRADGYKQAVIANAEGDASRFGQILTEYVKAPEVTRQRLYLETMQQVYANTSKVVVDTKGQGNLLYLPLDKLMQAGAAGSMTNPASTSSATASAQPGSATTPQRDSNPSRAAGGFDDPASFLSRDRRAR
ncbi:MAG: FtsH protease activity modulator HflK [Betaproteobacteria bacterium]|nr:FtsH protease activity modulator HflK [Betaproteobacteria bacterium]